MKITKLYDFDNFFHINNTNHNQNKHIQKITINIIKILINIFSKNLNISEVDAENLIRENANHSISVFVDTFFRIENIKDQINIKKLKLNENDLIFFLNKNYFNQNIGNSRIVRESLTNKILNVLGYEDIIKLNDRDYNISEIKSKNNYLTKENYLYYKFKVKNNLDFIKNDLINFFKLTFFSKKIKIGYISINKRNLYQLKKFKFISLNKKFKKSQLEHNFKERREFYFKNISFFIQEFNQNQLLQKLNNKFKINNNFIKLLFIFSIFQLDQLVFNPEKFKNNINLNNKIIKDLNLQAVISESDWYKFKNAILAVSLRKYKIPIIMYHNAGGNIYNIGDVYKKGSSIFDQYNFINYVLMPSDLPKKINSQPYYLKVPNIEWSKINNSYKLKNKKKDKIKIMYTPITLSYVYNIENMNNANPENLLQHRNWINKFFVKIDDSNKYKDVELFIKYKQNTNKFKNYNWLYDPNFNLQNIKINKLLKGPSYFYYNQLNAHIFCGPSTSFAESMICNIPSICLYNPSIYELNSEFEKLYKDLLKSGIICSDENIFLESLDKFIFNDVWFNTDIQKLRKDFCNTFAYTDKKWKKIWSQELLKSVNGNLIK